MGRQLAIIATPGDERELLRFMQTLSPIAVFAFFTKTPEALWIDDWERRDIQYCTYRVWLQSFPWVPQYKQTGGPRCAKESRGNWYVSNSGTAPVIEVSRPISGGSRAGRVYWAKDFSAADGLAYDATAFSKKVDRIWSWIRRVGNRQRSGGRHNGPYFLPEAWTEVIKHSG